MVQDLFTKSESAKVRLYKWLQQRKHVLSHEIVDWGTKNNCNWAMTRLNELKREGKIRKMPDNKRISYYGNGREKAWELVNHFNPSNIGVDNG